MMKLKVRVFASGKLSGEGFLNSPMGGTVGKTIGCNVLSPAVEEQIRIWKTFRGKITIKCTRKSLKEVQVDGVSIDRHILIKLGVLRKRMKSEHCTLPAKSLLKLIFEGYDLIISEDLYVRETVSDEVMVSTLGNEFRRRPFAGDSSFLAILTASFLCYTILHTSIILTKAPKINVRKDIPRRFTRFIYEPPPTATKTMDREISIPKQEKSTPDMVKPEKEEKIAKKPGPKAERASGKEPAPLDRNKIREKIARKGILGVLTGKGKAGSIYSKNILNRVDEVSQIDVKVAKLEDIQSPVGKEDSSLVDSNISSLIEGSDLGAEKEFETRVYKTETGAEIELTGDVEDGDRSAQVISSVINSYLGGIKYIYNRELKSNPNLSGKITVSYIINKDGTVSDIMIKESTVDWPPLEDKLIKRINHWKFPPSKSGRVKIVFPFLFFPSM